MDHHKSVKRDYSDDATKVNNCANAIKSMLNVGSIISMSDMISSLSQCSNTDSLFVYDVERGNQYALLTRDDIVYTAEFSAKGNRVVIADLKNRRLEVYENKVPIDNPATLEVIDLDANGRRWEGYGRNGKPFGYGVLFNEEGKKEYEGFMVNGIKTCYGTEYYSDIGRVKYSGCYYYNNRFGKGTLYDRNGAVDRDGLWKNDKPYSPKFDGGTMDNHTKFIAIPNNSFNESDSFIVPSFVHSLKLVVIANDCFGSVQSFELSELSELEGVVIGKKSFTCVKADNIWDHVARTDAACRIVNCPKLKSIQIGNGSFSDCYSLELTNLPSLQSIVFGECCFYHAPSFSLTGLFE